MKMLLYYRIWILLLVVLTSLESVLALFIQADSIPSELDKHTHLLSDKEVDRQVKEPHPWYFYSIYNDLLKSKGKNKTVHRETETEKFQTEIEFPLIPAQNQEKELANFPGLYSQEVILFRLAASGLPDKDFWSGTESDPFVKIYYTNESKSDDFENFARTSTLTDKNEPEWQETIKFEKYLRGTGQKWRFELRDNDVGDFDDHIGFAVVDIDDCVQQSRLRKIRAPPACTAQITNGNGVLYVEIL